MDEDVKIITKQIVDQIAPVRLILFGSRAMGKTNTNSDIDLCVVSDRNEDKSEDFTKIRRALGNSIVPIDILILGREEFEKRKNILGTVQYEIDKKGIVLYER